MIDFLKEAAGVVPSKRQLAWFDTGFYAFMHFGVNTYTASLVRLPASRAMDMTCTVPS